MKKLYLKQTQPGFIFLLATLAIFAGGCQKETEEEAPVAAFTYTSASSLPATVHFLNTSTSPGGPSVFAWDFGDGSGSVAIDPVHSYTQPGTYIVELIQTPSSGSPDTVRMALTISTAAGPAGVSNRQHGTFAANFTYSIIYSGYAFTFVNKSDNASSYVWDFGDGTTSTSTADTVRHTYTASGSYHINLAATNISGVDTCGATVSF